jgi:endonuclease/exonuclease/phosphatase family metal-dependent hydrolase
VRVVTWNMNQRERTDSHHEAWTFLIKTLNPDVALVQEAVVPEAITARYRVLSKRAWPHEPWGSAILSRVGDLTPDWEDSSRGAVLVARCSVSLLGSVSIASMHARVPRNGGVIAPLRLTFDALRTHLGDRFIVGGDLNTARAAALAWPQYGHGEFWNDTETWGFKEPLPDGGERQSYWGRWLKDELPAIGNSLQDDHIFVDPETFGHVTRCLVWDTRRVRELSDHGPVVVDLALPGESRGGKV